MVGADLVREVEPGEIVTIDAHGVRSTRFVSASDVRPAHCLFEHVYFARPDSQIFGDDVHEVRVRLGEQLAVEHPANADVVIAVPDSGRSAAIGFARRSGIPYDMGLIRSHYVGRSFIKPHQLEREKVVDLKFNVVHPVIAGKRVVVVEDSLIRGTTFQRMARLLREGGAKEIHLRITCPPTRWPCYYGIDFPTRDQLVAARMPTVEAIRDYIGVDSLGYLSVKGLLSAVSRPITHYCTACWTGQYPVPPTDQMDKYGMEMGCNDDLK
jgi:amidophosphoribosyltransferase